MWRADTLSVNARGASALFLGAIIYATYGPLTRILATSLSDYTQIALRFALAALIIIVWHYVQHRSLPQLRLPYREVAWSVVLGLAFGIMAVCFTEAILHIKIGSALFLLYAGTIITSVLLGTLVHKESLTRGKVIAIVLSAIGLFLFAAPFASSGTTALAWIGIGFTAGVGDGVANVVRKTLRDTPRSSVLLYQFLVCSAIGGVALTASSTPIVSHLSLPVIIAIIVFACLQALLGNLLLYAFSHFDVNVGTIILACELLFAALFGFVFFHETLTIFEVIGGLCIASGAVVVAAQ